jgi:hypothetical protein
MAVAFVQAASGDNGGGGGLTCTATFATPTVSGNCIAVEVNYFFGSSTISGVADNFGNVYVKDTGSAGGSGTVGGTEWWVAKNITGGSAHVVTVTQTPNVNFLALGAVELSGADTTSPVNVSNVTLGTGTPINTEFSGNPLTTTVDGCMLLTAFAFSNDIHGADPAGYTRCVFSLNENIHIERLSTLVSPPAAVTPKGKNGSGATNDWYLSAIAIGPTAAAPSFPGDDATDPSQLIARPWRARLAAPRGHLVDFDCPQAASLKNFKLEEQAWLPPARPWAARTRAQLIYDAVDLPLAIAAPPSVVDAQQIKWDWTNPTWDSPGAITLSGVQAGDTIVCLLAAWYPDHNDVATDSAGTLTLLIDQGTVHASTDHVYGQLYIEANASAGTHVITPPDLRTSSNDGTFYVLVIRGLRTSGVVRATGEQHANGSAITGNTVALTTANAQTGDMVVAFSLYDNTTQLFTGAGYSNPPSGWTARGVNQDAANNIPSQLSTRLAPGVDNESVSWTWTDTTVNVTSGIIIALAPLSSPDTADAGVFTENGQAALFQTQMVAAAGATADAGQAAAFTAGLAAAAGGTTEAGQAASFQASLVAAAGTFAESGGAAGGQTQFGAAAGGTADAGQDAAFQVSMASGAGATTDLGEDAAFQAQLVAAAGGTVDTFADAGGVMATVAASGGGTFAEAGQAATFTAILAAAAGGTVDTFAQAGGAGGSTADGATFTESGQPATFTSIMAAAGAGTLEAGQGAAFRAQLVADVGGTVDAGQDAPGVVVLHAQGGVFTETFSPATDIHPPLPTVDYRADVVDLGPAHPVTVVDLGPRYRITIKEVL